MSKRMFFKSASASALNSGLIKSVAVALLMSPILVHAESRILLDEQVKPCNKLETLTDDNGVASSFFGSCKADLKSAAQDLSHTRGKLEEPGTNIASDLSEIKKVLPLSEETPLKKTKSVIAIDQ